METSSTSAVWDLGAKKYGTQAGDISFYNQTNALMLDCIAKDRKLSVMDLGCGSNSQILRGLLNRQVRPQTMLGVDISHQMIEESKKNFADAKNVDFLISSSESLSENIQDKFDIVTMNSALLLTDVSQTLDAINKILTMNGLFIFSVPEWHLKGSKSDLHPKYQAINCELLRRGLPQKKQSGANNRYFHSEIVDLVGQHGYEVENTHSLEIQVSVNDWLSFYSIPSFAALSLPHLSVDTALEVLAAAIATLEGVEMPNVEWMIFSCQKTR